MTDPSLDAKAAEIASMVGGGKDSNLDDDQESEGHGSISGGPTTFKRSVLKKTDVPGSISQQLSILKESSENGQSVLLGQRKLN